MLSLWRQMKESMTLDRLRRMLTGANSQARNPDPPSSGRIGSSSLLPSRPEAHTREIHSHKQSPSTGPENTVSHPSWEAGGCKARTLKCLGSPSPEESPSTDCKVYGGSLARLSRHREARMPFSKFLDEVTVRVLDPVTLESFRGSQGYSQEPSPGDHSTGPAREAQARITASEKDLAQSPWHSLEATGITGLEEQGNPACSPSLNGVSPSPVPHPQHEHDFVPHRSCLTPSSYSSLVICMKASHKHPEQGSLR